MAEKTKYFVLKQKAVPEVLLKFPYRRQQRMSASAGVLSINTKMIFSHFMIMQRERQSPW